MKKGRNNARKSRGSGTPTSPTGWAEPPSWSRVEWAVAIVISLWIVVLHGLFLFHTGPLWRDEVGTIDFASMPTVGDIWHNLQYDNFPPLFVGIARVWTLAGLTSDFSFRVLGFLIGVATLGVIWFSARQCGVRVPLLALSLYALNPLAIRVGDSMRPYGLGIALTMLAFALIWRFVENPQAWTLFWAAIVAVLGVQCLYQNAIFLVAFSVGAWSVALARRQWKTAVQIFGIGIAAALSLLPWLPSILKGRDWLDIAQRPVTLPGMETALLEGLTSLGSASVLGWLMVIAGGVVLFLFAISKGKAKGTSGDSWRAIYFATAFAASALLYVLFLRHVGLQPRPWYFLILFAVAALALDVVLASFQAVRLSRAVLAVLVTVLCGSACLSGVQLRATNADLVAATLRQQSKPDDLILVSPWYFGVSLQRYFGTNGLTTLPPMDEIRIHRYDLMKQQMEAADPIGPLLGQVRQTLRSGHAVWVAGMFQFPPPGSPQPLYGPYHGGMAPADATYFSSWMFQVSALIQSHATSGGQLKVPVPLDAPVNLLEDIPLLVFRGWKE